MDRYIAVANRLLAARGDTPRRVVANATNISVSALTMYETGQRIPRDEIKMALAAYYGKTVQALFY